MKITLFVVLNFLMVAPNDKVPEKTSVADLADAIIRDDVAKVQRILDADSALLNRTVEGDAARRGDHEHQTALFWAVNRPKTATLLLNMGADVNFRDIHGRTPVYVAASSGDEAYVRKLLDKGANPDSFLRSPRETPVQAALLRGHISTARLLIARGAKSDVFAAAGFGDMKILSRLFEVEPAVLRATNENGDTPAHFASALGQAAVIGWLGSHGASFEVENRLFQTPLHVAGSAAVVDVMFKQNAGLNVDVIDGFGKTPLHDAVTAANLAVVNALLAHGADVNAMTGPRKIIAPNGPPNEPLAFKNTPLHLACCSQEDSGQMVARLLSAGANPELKNAAGEIPLGVAAKVGNEGAVRLLKKKLAERKAAD